MNPPPGSILPPAYFDGLSQLWGATAYVAAAIVAAALAMTGWMNRSDPMWIIKGVVKVFLVGVATLFLREWLMRLGDIVTMFGNVFGIAPTDVDEKFIKFLSGSSPSQPNASAWDVIWNTGSIGTAIAYALLWLFGWFAYGVQFIVKLVGDILLSAGWSLSPLFLAFFLVRPMASVGLKYVLGLVVLVCWPFGWVIAAVVTDAMLQAAATASLLPVIMPSGGAVAPLITVLIIGVWMLISSALAPYVLYRVLMSGANPAAAFAQGLGGVAQATLAGGVGAATAAVTGGASVPATAAAAALGAMAAGTESAARGGGSPRTTATVVGGAAGLYGGRFIREQTAAMKDMAAAGARRAAASERFEAHFSNSRSQSQQRQSDFPNQPHHPDPNQAAIEIEARHV
jgi:type IV secretion system protein TrbL